VTFENSVPLHPTAQKLVDTVITMLETTPYTNIKSESVLIRSGISRGPLYHHFRNFEELIATAHSQIYKSTVEQFTRQLLTIISSAPDIATAKQQFTSLLTAALSESTTSQRRVRLGVLHGASSSSELRGEVASIQEGFNRRWIEIHQICIDKGWSKLRFTSESIAIIMQSSLLGRVFDDMALTQMDLGAWIFTLTGIFEFLFLDAIA